MKKTIIALSLLFVLFFSPHIVIAQWCGGDPANGVDTALGCIRTSSLNIFVTDILRWGVGLSSIGGLFAISYGGILIMSSGGDAKKIKAGQEMITSAITGIALIVLSTVFLNFVGIDILNLGGLGF